MAVTCFRVSGLDLQGRLWCSMSSSNPLLYEGDAADLGEP